MGCKKCRHAWSEPHQSPAWFPCSREARQEPCDMSGAHLVWHCAKCDAQRVTCPTSMSRIVPSERGDGY